MNRLFAPILALSVAGCVSVEYTEAVARGEAPWYLVTMFSPDSDVPRTEMSVYRVVRRADSPEGKEEGLKADRWWGEGHQSIVRKDGAEIRASITIEPEPSAPGVCGFELIATYVAEKAQHSFVSKSAKGDSCDKSGFEVPYFSTRLQTQDRSWITLDLEFRRGRY
jgi:hypothetical protein